MKKIIFIGTIVVLLIGIGVVALTRHKDSGVVIPAVVEQQINFPTLTPIKQTPALSTKESSFKFDKSQKVLSFIVDTGGTNITFTEQAYPDVLIYNTLVGTLNQYAEIQTKIGKVELTRPKSAGGSQVAVSDPNNQTLMFARATKDMTNSQWQQLFNSLQISN